MDYNVNLIELISACINCIKCSAFSCSRLSFTLLSFIYHDKRSICIHHIIYDYFYTKWSM